MSAAGGVCIAPPPLVYSGYPAALWASPAGRSDRVEPRPPAQVACLATHSPGPAPPLPASLFVAAATGRETNDSCPITIPRGAAVPARPTGLETPPPPLSSTRRTLSAAARRDITPASAVAAPGGQPAGRLMPVSCQLMLAYVSRLVIGCGPRTTAGGVGASSEAFCRAAGCACGPFADLRHRRWQCSGGFY